MIAVIDRLSFSRCIFFLGGLLFDFVKTFLIGAGQDQTEQIKTQLSASLQM